MLKNYLNIAFRKLGKNRLDTAISIGGLSVGIACCLLLVAFVHFEWSHDSFHEQSDRTYRIYQQTGNAETQQQRLSAMTPEPLARSVKADYTGIEEVVRTSRTAFDIRMGEKFQVVMALQADEGFFSIFSFPLIHGDPGTALGGPGNLVLTREKAQQLFGRVQVVGETVTVRAPRADGEVRELTVTGVVENIPPNSSISFDYLLPINSAVSPLQEMEVNNWHVSGFGTFVLFRNGDREIAPVEEQLTELIASHYPAGFFEQREMAVKLQPLEAMYLSPEIRSNITESSNPLYSWILACIAIVVLAIAAINFMSLTLSRAAARSGEIGIRKVVGAGRSDLMRQFLGEAFITCLFAFIVGGLLAELAMPWFQDLVAKPVTFALSDPALWLILGGLLMVATLITGGYPAMVLSRKKIATAFESRTMSGKTPMFVKGLIVVQFTLAIAFLSSAFIMYSQMNYIGGKDLGFESEHVVEITLSHTDPEKGGELFDRYSQEVRRIPGVESVTAIYRPYGGTSWSSLIAAGGINDVNIEIIDEHFLSTMNIDLVEGRDYSEDRPSDIQSGILLNRAAVEAWGWESPVGKPFPESEYGSMLNGKVVVGVIENYHYASLMREVEPVVFLHRSSEDNQARLMRVKIAGGSMAQTIDRLENVWNEMNPTEAFDYSFFDDVIAQQYAFQQRWKAIIELASGIAIILACFGLFGLAALSAQKRTKEIGIRKVLGATVSHLVALLSKDFVRLVAAGFLIAVPIAFYAMNRWLADFAYKIEIGPGIFMVAGGAALLIALATVSWQSVRAAMANPVDSLRSE